MKNDEESSVGHRISKAKGKTDKGEQRPTGDKGGLSIADVPKSIRDAAGSQMDQIQIRPNHHIVGIIQQLGDARKVGENVQILLNALDECKNQMTTVAHRGNEELHRRGYVMDEDDRWRRRRQW